MWASCRKTAGRALHIGRVSASVLKEYNLLVTLQSIGNAIESLLIEVQLALVALDIAHRVRDTDFWQLHPAISLGK